MTDKQIEPVSESSPDREQPCGQYPPWWKGKCSPSEFEECLKKYLEGEKNGTA